MASVFLAALFAGDRHYYRCILVHARQVSLSHPFDLRTRPSLSPTSLAQAGISGCASLVFQRLWYLFLFSQFHCSIAFVEQKQSIANWVTAIAWLNYAELEELSFWASTALAYLPFLLLDALSGSLFLSDRVRGRSAYARVSTWINHRHFPVYVESLDARAPLSVP